jgi:hypothetical protein
VKIITKPIVWKGTENPYVSVLECPMCHKPGAQLDPAVVLTDGPQQRHVNFWKVEGKMITIRGVCPDCKAAFLLRILLAAAGTYAWHDLGVTAKIWNALLTEKSKDQLPCMCLACQQKGMVKPAHDESTASPSFKASIAKLKASNADVVDADIVDTKVVSIINEEGMALTVAQHQAIAKALKADWPKLAEGTGMSVKDTQIQFVNVIEAYVRIKFATFQPQDTDDPDRPPKFPTIVPKTIVAGFKQSGEKHLCEYIVTAFAMVDQVLGRPDLPASIIYHHMCPMCKLEDCKFHPTNRKE